MKTNLTHIKDTITKEQAELEKTYNVAKVGIFGSFARGDNTDNSDIDVLVSFSKPVGMVTFIRLEERLSQLLGRRVDLVTPKALKPAIKDEVLHEVVYV